MATVKPQANAEATDKLSHELLEALDKMFGLHAGFRPVHAKGHNVIRYIHSVFGSSHAFARSAFK